MSLGEYAEANRRSVTYATDDLYREIGRFLGDHRLSPDPTHYAFVHAILSEPDGPLARAVAALVDGGVRLHRDDISRLGGPQGMSQPVPMSSKRSPRANATRLAIPPVEAQTAALAEQTQDQVETFAEVIRAIQADTSAFGVDLARNAAELQRGDAIGLTTLATLTGEMLKRIHATENSLNQATAEAETLREKLTEARAVARRDPLTGLANRLGFNEALTQCFQLTSTCHLALCDVDRFKRINDEHGHAVGDRVLLAIGNILAEECSGHLVCRHGGEEFAILISNVSDTDAFALIERARDTLRARHMRVRESDKPLGPITFSAGITAFRAGDTQESLFARADALLYRAKNEGRDRAFADT